VNYLLDTNVISAIAPTKRDRRRDLVEWLDRASGSLYLSVVTVAEIRGGIAKAEREGATRKAANLTDWWETVEHLYGDRILTFDLPAARIAGRMIGVARSAGCDPGFADIIIAATAQSNRLTILTANTKHFMPIVNFVINPFEGLPSLTNGLPTP
jgi:predicted nucleic acid-binding protein